MSSSSLLPEVGGRRAGAGAALLTAERRGPPKNPNAGGRRAGPLGLNMGLAEPDLRRLKSQS